MAQEYQNVFTFRSPDELIKKVDQLAKKLQISRSEIIREALEEYLAEKEIIAIDKGTGKKYSKKQIERLLKIRTGLNTIFQIRIKS
ncbi:MAG: CopG family ribbon-helix-helix protein [Candidatus Heimdallarchaeaceae archaeon]